MTVSRMDVSTLSQREEVSSSNGASSVKDEGARDGNEWNGAPAMLAQ